MSWLLNAVPTTCKGWLQFQRHVIDQITFRVRLILSSAHQGADPFMLAIEQAACMTIPLNVLAQVVTWVPVPASAQAPANDSAALTLGKRKRDDSPHSGSAGAAAQRTGAPAHKPASQNWALGSLSWQQPCRKLSILLFSQNQHQMGSIPQPADFMCPAIQTSDPTGSAGTGLSRSLSANVLRHRP